MTETHLERLLRVIRDTAEKAEFCFLITRGADAQD
jgi:hypothetical protein